MSPIQGFVRLRKHQFGRQASFGSAVAATKAYPISGVPDVNLNWTDREVDEGSRFRIATPYRGAPELSASYTDDAVEYNTLPKLMAALFGGGEVPTGGGTAQTWHFRPSSLTVDDPDLFTEEFGDDVLTDWYQFRDGVLDSIELTGEEGLGPIKGSYTWRYGAVASTGSTDSPVVGTVPTPDLAIDPEGVIIYLKDMGIFVADSIAGLSGGQIMDALHAFALRINVEWDEKRFANQAQNFDVNGYGPGLIGIELDATYAKTTDTVGTGSESDDWMSDQSVNRYIKLSFLCTVLAQTPSTFYSFDVIMPMRYYTRTETDINGNTAIVLNAHAFYDPEDAEYAFDAVIVNTLTEEELGEVPS